MKRRGFLKLVAAALVALPLALRGHDEPKIKEVVAQTRKLKTRWTLESAQDLQNMHNVDIEESLTEMLAREISKDIDAEITRKIISGVI